MAKKEKARAIGARHRNVFDRTLGYARDGIEAARNSAMRSAPSVLACSSEGQSLMSASWQHGNAAAHLESMGRSKAQTTGERKMRRNAYGEVTRALSSAWLAYQDRCGFRR